MDNKVTVDEALEAVERWQRQDATLAFVDLHTCRIVTGSLAAELERLRADAERYSQLRTWVEDRTKPSEESCIVISQDDFGAVVIEGKSIYAIGDSFSAAIDAARGE